MKKMRARYIIFTLSAAAVGLSSCMKEAPGGGSGDGAVRFDAEVAAAQATRVLNDQWQTGDRIGVFMLAAEGRIEADVKEGAYNRPYIYDGGFTAEGGDIYYPKDGTAQLDFAAVYPWREDTEGSQYPFSVAAQNDPAAIDLMYARTQGVTSPADEPVTLTFYHKLSWLAIKVNVDNGITDDLSDMTAVIGGMPAGGTLDLNDGTMTANAAPGNITMLKGPEEGTGYDAVFDAIVLPSESDGGRSVLFTIADNDYTWEIPDSVVLTEGLRHTYIINVRGTGVEFIGATITPWDEEAVMDGGEVMFSVYLSGSGLKDDIFALSPDAVKTWDLRIIGGELTPDDFGFMLDNMPNLGKLDLRYASIMKGIIPDHAFYDIKHSVGKQTLRRVILPEGVSEIGSKAFYDCLGLTSVTCLSATPPTLGLEVFVRTSLIEILVPAQSVNAYKSAANWRVYSAIIKPIPQP